MAALSCICTSHPGPSRIDSRQPPAIRGYPEVSINSSASICSPPWCRWDAQSLRWDNSLCGIQQKRGIGFRRRASIVGQEEEEEEEEEEALSEEGSSSRSGSSVGLVQDAREAADIVREFYDKLNQRDYLGLTSLFSEDYLYEDFNFSKPTRGKEIGEAKSSLSEEGVVFTIVL